jgi:hypothetical protein
MSWKCVPHFSRFRMLTVKQEEIKEPKVRILSFFPELTQTATQWTYIAADCCSHRDTVPVMFIYTKIQHIYCTNCTVYSWTVLRVITQMLLLHVQLHNSRTNLLHTYCTNRTVYSWTVLTVITHKLLLHVHLHNSTAHLLYKYCANCTVYKWTVLTVITHKLLPDVQLYNSTAHLLYKYCTNCTVYSWTVLTLITD